MLGTSPSYSVSRQPYFGAAHGAAAVAVSLARFGTAAGVSKFMVEHLTALLEHATIVPAVNQIELHPYFQQRDVQGYGAEHGILTQAWSPIGDVGDGRVLQGAAMADVDFELSTDELAAIDGLDTDRRGGPEPEAVTLEVFGREIPEA